MTVRRRIASSSFARVAAFPERATVAGRHIGSEARLATRWLLRSREHTNYTYHLHPTNQEHMAWWVASVAKVAGR